MFSAELGRVCEQQCSVEVDGAWWGARWRSSQRTWQGRIKRSVQLLLLVDNNDKMKFGHCFSWLNNSDQWYENCATDCICQFFILVLDLHCILLPDSLTDYKMVVAQLLLTQQLTLWPTNKDRNISRLRFPTGQR